MHAAACSGAGNATASNLTDIYNFFVRHVAQIARRIAAHVESSGVTTTKIDRAHLPKLATASFYLFAMYLEPPRHDQSTAGGSWLDSLRLLICAAVSVTRRPSASIVNMKNQARVLLHATPLD